MAKSPRVLLSCSMVASSPLAALKAHFTLNWKWYWSEVTHFCAWNCEPLRCGHCNWIGPTASHQGSESKDHLWHLNPEPRAFKQNTVLRYNKYKMWPHSLPFFFYHCTYLIRLHGPFTQLRLILWSLSMKSHQHPYRRRRTAETRGAWDCGGTSPRMRRSPERTTPPGNPDTPAVGPAD